MKSLLLQVTELTRTFTQETINFNPKKNEKHF